MSTGPLTLVPACVSCQVIRPVMSAKVIDVAQFPVKLRAVGAGVVGVVDVLSEQAPATARALSNMPRRTTPRALDWTICLICCEIRACAIFMSLRRDDEEGVPADAGRARRGR